MKLIEKISKKNDRQPSALRSLSAEECRKVGGGWFGSHDGSSHSFDVNAKTGAQSKAVGTPQYDVAVVTLSTPIPGVTP